MICSPSKGFIADSNFHFGLLVSDIPGKLELQIVSNSQDWFLRINPATTNLELLACRACGILESRELSSPLAKDRWIWIGTRLREWIEGRFLKPPLFWTFHALKTPKRGWFEKSCPRQFPTLFLVHVGLKMGNGGQVLGFGPCGLTDKALVLTSGYRARIP